MRAPWIDLINAFGIVEQRNENINYPFFFMIDFRNERLLNYTIVGDIGRKMTK